MTATRTPPGFSDPQAFGHPTSIRQAVAWGELDALGHVNHTVFLRWLENVRLAWFEQVGVGGLMQASQGGVGPILARVSCDYRAPVGFPDTIWASACCSDLGRSSLTLSSRVWSEKRKEIVAEGEVVVVLFDYGAGRSMPIPAPIRAAIRTLDAAVVREVGRETP